MSLEPSGKHSAGKKQPGASRHTPTQGRSAGPARQVRIGSAALDCARLVLDQSFN
jgi:hypothetical protein